MASRTADNSARRRVTLKDIADALGLSPTTVSFVLNRRDMGISEETRERVLAKAGELGYLKPSSVLQRDQWTRAAFLSRSLPATPQVTTFFSSVRSHFERQAQSRGMQAFSAIFDPERTTDTSASVHALGSIGADIMITNSGTDAAYLARHNLPVIAYQAGPISGVTSIYCDDREAGKQAALHALEMGHTRAGLLFPGGSSFGVRSRLEGFRDAFLAGGGACPPDFHWTIPWDHDKIVRIVHDKACGNDIPSLFYCYADNLVFPFIRGAHMAGLRVPEDVSVIGTDDLHWGRFSVPAITTVHLCEELFAAKLIDAVKHVLAGGAPYHLAVPVRLVARETVRKIASEGRTKRTKTD